jgi:hypothetical protein
MPEKSGQQQRKSSKSKGGKRARKDFHKFKKGFKKGE